MENELTLDRNSWSTPQWLYSWLNSIYNFDIDLCASKSNAKHSCYFSELSNALERVWHCEGDSGFCNPPYSDISPWINKAVSSSNFGFTSVLLIPTPNGETHYKQVFKRATSITFIEGRVAFIAPFDYVVPGKKGKPDRYIKKGDEVGGNTRGSCVVEFSKKYNNSSPIIRYFSRDELKKKFL